MLNLINLKQRHPNIAGELFRNRYWLHERSWFWQHNNKN
jgi:hypothetical protein